MKHAFLLIAILSVMAQAQAVVLSDFEGQGNGAMPQGWLKFIAGKKGTAFADSENVFSGRQSLCVRIDDNETTVVVEQDKDSLFAVTPGQDYKVTFRYKLSETDNAYIHPFLIGANADGNNLPFQFFRSPAMQRVDKNMKDAVNIFDSPSETWKEIYIKFRAPANVSKVKFHVESEGKCRYNIDDIRIEEIGKSANGIVWEADFQHLDKEDVRKSKRIAFSGEVKATETSEGHLALSFAKGAAPAFFSLATDELIPLNSYTLQLQFAKVAPSTGQGQATLLFRRSSGQILHEQSLDIDEGQSLLSLPFLVPEECGLVEIRIGGQNVSGEYEIASMAFRRSKSFDEKAGIYASAWQSDEIWDTYPNGLPCERKNRIFRKTFKLDAAVTEARIRMLGHNKAILFVNGKHYGAATLFQPQTFDIADSLKPGPNVIAIQAQNSTGGVKLAFDVYWEDVNGKTGFFGADDTTKVAEKETDGWTSADFDDSAWKNASVIGDSSDLFFRNGKNYIGPRHVFAIDRLDYGQTFHNDKPLTIRINGKYAKRHDFSAFDDNDFVGMLSFSNGEQFYSCSLTASALQASDNGLALTPLTKYLPEGDYDLTLELYEYKFDWKGQVMSKIDLGVVKCLGFSQAPAKPTAKIVSTNGKNTIAVDGKPICPVTYLLFHPDFSDIKKLNDNNIKIHQIYVDSYGPATLNGDRIITPDGRFDFAKTDKILYDAMQLVKDDEQSYFIINLPVHVPLGWGEDLQDHVVTTSAGNKIYVTNGRYCLAYDDKANLKRTPFGAFAPSSASPIYEERVAEYTRTIIEHLENSPFSQRIIGYGLAGAFDGQWLNWELEGPYMYQGGMGDYSPVMLKAFRDFLKEKYADVNALRKAWGIADVTFDTAEIPSYEQRTKFFVDRQVADYNELYYRTSFKVFKRVCDTAKSACNQRALIWAYKPESAQITYSFGTQKTTTHLGPEVYGLKSLDIYSNPVDYYTRTLGIPTLDAPTAASLKIRGKLSRPELDLRSYLTGDMRMFLTPHTLKGTEEYFKKNAIALYMNGSTNHYYEFYPGWFNNSALNKTMGKLAEIDFDAIQAGMKWEPKICMLFSARSNLYLGNFDGKFSRFQFFKFLAEMRRFSSTVMGRIGAGGYDGYYLEDILLDNFPEDQYKVYVIVEAYHIPAALRDAIERKLKKNHNVIVWMWGDGFLDENCRLSATAIEQNTGFAVKQILDAKMVRQITIADADHPFIAGMQGRTVLHRTSENYNPEIPVFCVNDDKATVLGTFPDGSTALAVKHDSQSASVYCAVHSIPPEFLRNVLRSRGVHIFADNDHDYVYTDGNYLALHSGGGGHKTVPLPEKVRQVYDVFREKTVAEDTDNLEFDLEDDETAIFKLFR